MMFVKNNIKLYIFIIVNALTLTHTKYSRQKRKTHNLVRLSFISSEPVKCKIEFIHSFIMIVFNIIDYL